MLQSIIMGQYVTINVRLIRTLTKVIRMTNEEISAAAGIPIATWYRIAKKPENISIQQLLALANGLHIPVSRFLSDKGRDYIGLREDYIMSVRDYRQCSYDGDALRAQIGRQTDTTRQDAAKVMDLHYSHVSSAILGEQRLKVANILTLCAAFRLEVSDYIIDPNAATVAQKQKPSRRSQGTDTTDELKTIREELRRLSEDNAQLRKDNDQLREDYNRLRDAHNILARRLSEQDRRPHAHKPSAATYDGIAADKLPMAAEED